MGSGGGGSSDSTIKYSPYLESLHNQILTHSGSDIALQSVIGTFNTALNQSPYDEIALIDGDAVFGTSAGWVYPTLFDMFGKFMAGLDIEALWSQIYTETVNGAEVANSISAHSATLQDEIDTNILPKMLAGFRDVNSVMGSAFVVARGIVSDSKIKSLNKFGADLRMHMIDVATDRWKTHLEWNKQVILSYAELTKLYISASMDLDTMKADFLTKDRLWNLKLFEYVRAMLGAMQGAATSPGLNEPSQLQKSVSGAMTGAALGAQVGGSVGAGGYGAAAGAVIGLAASFA